MNQKQIMETLQKNVSEYYNRKTQIDLLEEKQEELKDQNLSLVKMIEPGLKKGDCCLFDEIGLQIQLLEMKKVDRIDELGLVKLVGKEIIDPLKTVSIELVRAAIKSGKLPKNAGDYIVYKDTIEYTKITPIAPVIEITELVNRVK